VRVWPLDPLIRFRPRLQLRDLDNCMFMPVLNKSLSEKLDSIQVFANGYKLADIGLDEFEIDTSPIESTIPGAFTPEELGDSWVRIRPARRFLASTFHLRFTPTTPSRMYTYTEIRHARSALAQGRDDATALLRPSVVIYSASRS
jgi:hypothetical protein